MTRKHFEFLARFIVKHDLSWEAMDEIIGFCKEQNPNFSEEMFRRTVEKLNG